MRKVSFVLLTLTLIGCQKEKASEAAVRATVTWQGFHPGCVRMTASDGTSSADSTVDGAQLQGNSGTVVIAVYRQESWGHALKLTALAYERTCGDPQAVSTDQHDVTVKRGSISELTFNLQATDQDGDGYVATAMGGTDCDDHDLAVHPGAPEICDGKDNDCDGKADEPFHVGDSCPVSGPCGGQWACDATDGGRLCKANDPNTPWYLDSDHDGHGAADAGSVKNCPGSGYVTNHDDCDDHDSNTYPGAPEICDGKDNDCDGLPDEPFHTGESCQEDGGCPGTYTCTADGTASYCKAPARIPAWPDKDHDGYGANDAGSLLLCPGQVTGSYVFDNTDCDDTRADVHPDAGEICDNVDHNCNGRINDGYNVGSPCPDAGGYGCSGTLACAPDGGSQCNLATALTTFYFDNDNDGYGTMGPGVPACVSPDAGYVPDSGDCDDGNPFIHPGAPEICDGRDNNCDNVPDEAPACPMDAGWLARRVGGTGDNYATVSEWDAGTADAGVWVAGASDKVLYKFSTDPTYYNGTCISGVNWNTSWTEPGGSGHVFLGGNNKSLYERDPALGLCTSANVKMTNITGLVGFRVVGNLLRIFGVDRSSSSFVFDPVSTNSSTIPNTGGRLLAVHGLSPDLMFAVGDSGGGTPAPRVYLFNTATNQWDPQTLPSGSNSGSLTAVWVVNPGLAYAVGNYNNGNGLVLQWDGKSWSTATYDNPLGTNGSLNAVLPFGSNEIYLADGNLLRRFYNGVWSTVFALTDASNNPQPITGIAGTSPADLWLSGHAGYVVHWPTTP